MDFLSLALLFCGLFVGWTIGANDAGNCMGPAVGAGILNSRKAILIVAIFAFLGAALHGEPTISTIGHSIVEVSDIPESYVTLALFTAALVITMLTFFGIPISTTQAVLGSVLGVGLVIHASVSWIHMLAIFFLGFLTPLVSLLVSYLLQRTLVPWLLRRATFLSQEKTIKASVLLSGIFLAFSLGANNVGNAVGLPVSKGVLTLFLGGIVGGLAMAIGVAMMGEKVMRTMGQQITTLDSTMALSAQLGASIVVFALTGFGIPTSFTFAIVGSIAGVGLVKGLSSLSGRTIGIVFSAWILTPLVSMLLTMMLLGLYEVIV